MITYRGGNETDFHEVSKLWLKMVNEIDPDFTPNIDWWKADTLNSFKNPGYVMIVTEDEGEIIAFTDGYIYPEPAQGKIVLFSRHSYVEPPYRHTPIIKMMYQLITDYARSKGAQALMFGCNDVTKPLWESKGYRQLEYTMVGDLHDMNL